MGQLKSSGGLKASHFYSQAWERARSKSKVENEGLEGKEPNCTGRRVEKAIASFVRVTHCEGSELGKEGRRKAKKYFGCDGCCSSG